MRARVVGPFLALLALVLTVRWWCGDGRVAIPILLVWTPVAIVAALAPGRLRGPAVACAATLLALAVAEGGLELRSRLRRGRSGWRQPAWTAYDPALGFRKRPGVWPGRGKESKPVTIGSAGFRLGSVRASDEAPIALVLGDSFGFGLHLPDDETMPYVLEERLGGRLDVLNLAMSGWGPHQTVAQLELGLDRNLGGRRRVVCGVFFAAVDAFRPTGQRPWSRSGPWYQLRSGRLQLVGDLADRRPWREELAWRTALGERAGRLLWPDRPDPELYTALLSRVAELVSRRHGAPTLFVLERGFGEVPIGPLVARLRSQGSTVATYDSLFPAGQVESFRLPDDGHPNAAGAARVAEYVAGEIERLGILRPAAP